jgi:hypothetical protein
MPHSQPGKPPQAKPSKGNPGHSIFDRLDRPKLPSIGRPLAQAHIDAAIAEAMEEQERRSLSR